MINRACAYVKIAGTADAEGECYSGLSAQMASANAQTLEMVIPAINGNLDEKDTPEVGEAKNEVGKAMLNKDNIMGSAGSMDFPGLGTPVAPDGGYRGLSDLQAELEKFFGLAQTDATTQDDDPTAKARGDETPPATTEPRTNFSFKNIAGILMATGMTVGTHGQDIMRFLSACLGFVGKHGLKIAAVMPTLAGVGSMLPEFVKKFLPSTDTLMNAFKTLIEIVSSAGNMLSTFVNTYMMVTQLSSMTDFLSFLSPEAGSFASELQTAQQVLGQTGTRGVSPENRGVSIPSSYLTKRPTIDVPTGLESTKYTVNNALRMICKSLPKFLANLETLNEKLEARVDYSDTAPKVYTLAQILHNSLNYDKPGLLGKPATDWSLAKILAEGLPVIEHTDSITGKKTVISALELIMQAQESKVLELGPGFLKWYMDADVLQHNIYANARAGTSNEPVSGT